MKKFIIFVAAFAMVGAFVATAMADVDLYGSARFRTYYKDVDSNDTKVYDDVDLEWQMGYLTRFGANFKSDKITGKFEMDARVASSSWDVNAYQKTGASSVGDMRLRLLWGEYDFGTWKFMIGQNYPLYDAPVSSLNYYSGGLQKFGGIGYDAARTSQMRFTFGDFRLALLPVDLSKDGNGITGYNTDEDVLFPKIELRYDLKFDAGALNFIGGYQTYKAVNATDDEKTIDSYTIGARGKFDFGPAYLGASLSYRQNGSNYGAWTAVDEAPRMNASGSVKDTTAWGGVVALGYKVNDSNNLELSYGFLSSENDVGDMNDEVQVIAANWAYTVAPGFYIVPEIIFQDNKNKDDSLNLTHPDKDKGGETIFGVFWRIDFK
jgi:hypothetical protein